MGKGGHTWWWIPSSSGPCPNYPIMTSLTPRVIHVPDLCLLFPSQKLPLQRTHFFLIEMGGNWRSRALSSCVQDRAVWGNRRGKLNTVSGLTHPGMAAWPVAGGSPSQVHSLTGQYNERVWVLINFYLQTSPACLLLFVDPPVQDQWFQMISPPKIPLISQPLMDATLRKFFWIEWVLWLSYEHSI